MSLVLIEAGAFRLEAKYLQDRKGVWFFRRRIPHDVRKLYPGQKDFLIFSLSTKDKTEAARLAHQKATQQNALWKAYRKDGEITGAEELAAATALLDKHGLKPGDQSHYNGYELGPDAFFDDVTRLSNTEDEYGRPTYERESTPRYANMALDMFRGERMIPHLSKAVTEYQEAHGELEGTKAWQSRRNALARFTTYAGDIPVNQYKREQANGFVASLKDNGLKGATIKRYLNYLTPVFRFVQVEYGLVGPHVFENITLPKFDSAKRLPFTPEELAMLQRACIESDDHARWAIAIASDTGMRLAEVTGLCRDDLVVESDVPHVLVVPNLSRNLKSPQSERMIPLVGASLWASKRVLTASSGQFVFPKYAGKGVNKSTAASNTFNKWIRTFGIAKTMHSFRHSMRDRLRDVNAPTELIDSIGGWSAKSVGQGYGQGASLRTKAEWMEKVVLRELWE